jgi:hypothetical protein
MFLAVAVVIVIGVATFLVSNKPTPPVTGEISKPQNITQMIELSSKIKLQYPHVYLINGTQQNIDSVSLEQIANNTWSSALSYDSKGPHGIVRDGLVKGTLYEGMTSDGKNIVEVTVTNTGVSTLYLDQFVMMGGTGDGRPIIGSSAIDSGYSAQVWGNIPSPTSTKLTILSSGQSISEYIEGNWIEPVTNQTVDEFGGNALFFYDKNDPNYNGGGTWEIMVPNPHLDLSGYSNSTS